MAASLEGMQRRQVLATSEGSCACAFAGLIAETYQEVREFDVWDIDGWLDPERDVEIAQGLAGLLPYRSEFEHAGELQRAGSMSPDAIAELLPAPELDWPPSAATRWRGSNRLVQ